LSISIFSKEVIRVLSTNEFVISANVLPLLILASIFYGIYFYTSIGIQIKKKTFYFPVVILIVAIINFILCFNLIPHYGYMGAGIAKLISYIILGLVINFISIHYYKIDYNLKKILIITVLSLSIFIIGINLNFQFIFLSVFLKIFLLFSFLMLLIILGFFEKRELQLLIQTIKSKLSIY
ncbi:polysaccharide biosynthesis C-terminal domain-containing protein, partial [candidate division KSB1 bacterium]|nr:polysaccharide biosynthesis C-terminal domain-containing protein [candidate division KSB1 bacterium]